MNTSFNDAEDEALRRLPWRARVAYLQGIRRYMDYRSGMSGASRVLSYQFFFELLEGTDRTTAPDQRVSKDGLRAIFKMLERAGLVEWIRGASAQRGCVFRCVLADRDESVQKQDAPKTHPRRTQQDAPIETSCRNGSNAVGAPKTHPRHTTQDAPPPVSGTPEREEGANAPLSVAAKSAAGGEDVAEVIGRLNAAAGTTYKAAAGGRPTRAAELVQARLREHGKEALLAMVDRKCRQWRGNARMEPYLRPTTLFGREKCGEYVGQLSLPEREDVDKARQRALEAWVNEGPGNVIEGVFSREQR